MIVDIRGEAENGARTSDASLGLTMADVLPDAVFEPLRAGTDDMLDGGDLAGWVPTLLAVAAFLAWIGGALWLTRNDLVSLGPIELVQFLASLAVVPVLIGVLWLLTRRSSRAEARRFGRTAASMRAEAASLERTVGIITRSLDENRARLAEQTTQLMAIGDATNERLGAIGGAFAIEISQADDHARRLDESAIAARSTVDALIDAMARAREDTDAASRLLDLTGQSATDFAGKLEAQLALLIERGREADMVAGGAAGRLAAHIVRMEQTGEVAGERLETAVADTVTRMEAMLARTGDAVEAARAHLTQHGDQLLTMVDSHQASLELAARDSVEALAQRIGGVEAIIERVTGRLEAERATGDLIVQGLDDGLAAVERRMEALHVQGVERSQLLAASISALGGSAVAMTEALRAGEAMATRTIGTTESLLIALDAAAREIDETLPEALTRLDQRIAASKSVVVQAKPELLALVTAAESTHDAIEAIAGVISEQRRTLDHLSTTLLETLSTGRAKADALGQMVDESVGQAHRFAEEAAPRLIDALLRVRETATVAADRARETLADVIPEAADAMESATMEAMRRATRDTVERHVQSLASATDAAVEAAARAGERLSHQVQAILEQTAIVETRIEDARAEREDADRDTFARRVSLLIESLNSASIDITKAFAPEVSDSAWAAYLKGDRGVFTRRAVRVLDANDAREVARFYDEDAGFREMVNRYIHDFESMLRAILAQRDGSPLGVTLLSSDMGKLYVALAQAIERLR